MYLSVYLFGFILSGALCTYWTWLTISCPMLWKFSAIISSNIFSGHFNFFFILFSIFLSVAMFSTICSPVTYLFFNFSYSAIDSFLCIVHLCFSCGSSRSSVNISWSFSIHSEILHHLCYHYSEFFFWKVFYVHFFYSFVWGFILCLNPGHNSLFFSFWLNLCKLVFIPLWDSGCPCFFCLPTSGRV